jgi:hypothetical protein
MKSRSRSGRELLELLLQLQPLAFELRQLARGEGLVDDQRLERFLVRVGVDRRVGEPGRRSRPSRRSDSPSARPDA